MRKCPDHILKKRVSVVGTVYIVRTVTIVGTNEIQDVISVKKMKTT